MARYDVYRNSGPHAKAVPYLLDVQCNLLNDLGTRVVVPLSRVDKFSAVKIPQRLTPVFSIEGNNYLLETPKLAAVPVRLLNSPVLSLEAEQTRITSALDFLFQGF